MNSKEEEEEMFFDAIVHFIPQKMLPPKIFKFKQNVYTNVMYCVCIFIRILHFAHLSRILIIHRYICKAEHQNPNQNKCKPNKKRKKKKKKTHISISIYIFFYLFFIFLPFFICFQVESNAKLKTKILSLAVLCLLDVVTFFWFKQTHLGFYCSWKAIYMRKRSTRKKLKYEHEFLRNGKKSSPNYLWHVSSEVLLKFNGLGKRFEVF